MATTTTATSYIAGAQRTQGLVAPAVMGEHVLVKLRGPGVFVCAEVSRQGDPAGVSFVSLDLDSRNIVSVSFEAVGNWGLTQDNPYGLVRLKGSGIDTLAIGYQLPLRFERELVLKVTVQEIGIPQILANVIHGI
jgi:hypothetical protein